MEPQLIPTVARSTLVQVVFRLFDAMGCGGILLDGHKRVVHLSGRARKNLRECVGITSGRLCALDRDSDALFQTLLDQALKYGDSPAQRRRQALGLKRPEKRPLIVRIVPVDPGIQHEMSGAALVVMLVDPEECIQTSDGILQQVFGMTRAEARVAKRIMCGDSLEDIANATHTSVGTIRSQTKSVFAKTGTHRQSELVGLLTRVAILSEDDE